MLRGRDWQKTHFGEDLRIRLTRYFRGANKSSDRQRPSALRFCSTLHSSSGWLVHLGVVHLSSSICLGYQSSFIWLLLSHNNFLFCSSPLFFSWYLLFLYTVLLIPLPNYFLPFFRFSLICFLLFFSVSFFFQFSVIFFSLPLACLTLFSFHFLINTFLFFLPFIIPLFLCYTTPNFHLSSVCLMYSVTFYLHFLSLVPFAFSFLFTDPFDFKLYILYISWMIANLHGFIVNYQQQWSKVFLPFEYNLSCPSNPQNIKIIMCDLNSLTEPWRDRKTNLSKILIMFYLNYKSLFCSSQVKTLILKCPIEQNLQFHQDGWRVFKSKQNSIKFYT